MSSAARDASAATIETCAEEFAQAWAKADTETLDRLLAADYLHTDFSGKVFDRSAWLAYARGPRDLDIDTDDLRVKVFDKVAVVTGYNRISDSREPNRVLEIRFTQVWESTPEGWRRSYFQATPIISRADSW